MALTTATSLSQLRAGTYRIDPHRSQVTYSSRHMFGLGRVHAAFTIRSGEIKIPASLNDARADAILDSASFTSDSAKRDKDVKSAGLLDVATYPDITFSSSDVSRKDGAIVLNGHVTAHGKTVPVEVLVAGVAQEFDGIRIHAQSEHLDRYAFGITKSKGLVGRWLSLEFSVFAVSE